MRRGRLDVGLGVGPAAVVEAHHPAVGRGPGVGAHAEGVPQGACHRQPEAAARAVLGCRVGRRCVRPVGPVVPPLGRDLAPLGGQHPLATEAQLPLGHPVDVLIAGGLEAGLEVGVLLDVGQHVGRAQVARGEPVGVGHPLGRDHGGGARQQGGLGHGDVLGPCDPGHGDGPAPVRVARVQAGEVVRRDALAVHHGCHVLAHQPRLGDRLGGLAGHVDRAQHGGVGLHGGHVISAPRRSRGRWRAAPRRSCARARAPGTCRGAARWRRRRAAA